MKIRSIKALEVLDSRGNPTVFVEVILNNGKKGTAFVPSGASTGTHEALELRDKDKRRFLGKGVLKAVGNINKKIAPKLRGKNSYNQEEIDGLMLKLDGTKNKTKLGANAILGVSLAVSRAAANSKNIPLYKHIRNLFSNYFKLKTSKYLIPVPLMNILNGGVHADNNIDLQEFMIAPFGFKTFKRAIQAGSEIYHSLKGILKNKKLSSSVGDEGGFAPNLKKNEDALKVIKDAIIKAGYKLGKEVAICLDPASSEFYKNGKYILKGEIPQKKYSYKEMTKMYSSWIKKYSIFSIEDGLSEDDWEGWSYLTEKLGDKIQIVGDDIFVTNPERLHRAINNKVANSILIKLNQIGSLTETLKVIALAYKNNYTAVISHRSGETEDPFISDLAVAVNSGQIKTGAPARSERVCKYNRLIYIEDELKGKSSLGRTLIER